MADEYHAELQIGGSNGILKSKRQILDSLKLKEFADDNFNFDEIAS